MEIIANPDKRKTQVVGNKNGVLILDVKGKAENNEANNEIIRFFSKSKEYNPNQLMVKIVKGLKQKKKVLKFY